MADRFAFRLTKKGCILKRITGRLWRVINTLLIVFGMGMPWIQFYFDMQVAFLDPPPITGWKYFLAIWQEVINRLIEAGFELLLLPFWLMATSGALIVLYLFLNLLILLRGRDHASVKPISILLFVIMAILSIPVFMGGKPFAGYWFVNLGIFSSAVLEWQNVDTQIS